MSRRATALNTTTIRNVELTLKLLMTIVVYSRLNKQKAYTYACATTSSNLYFDASACVALKLWQ